MAAAHEPLPGAPLEQRPERRGSVAAESSRAMAAVSRPRTERNFLVLRSIRAEMEASRLLPSARAGRCDFARSHRPRPPPAPGRSLAPRRGPAPDSSSNRAISTAHSAGAPAPPISKAPSCPMRDGDDPAVKLGGVAGIDFQFFLAGLLAFPQRRIIEERQPHARLTFKTRSPPRNTIEAWVSIRLPPPDWPKLEPSRNSSTAAGSHLRLPRLLSLMAAVRRRR